MLGNLISLLLLVFMAGCLPFSKRTVSASSRQTGGVGALMDSAPLVPVESAAAWTITTGDPEVVFDTGVYAPWGRSFDAYGYAHGVFLDGPVHPWKVITSSGEESIRFNLPNYQNFTVYAGNLSDPLTWKLVTSSFASDQTYLTGTAGRYYHLANQCGDAKYAEPDYDNNFFMYGFWSTGGAVYALAHFEYYRYCSPYVVNQNTYFNQYWVSGIQHLSSMDGGDLFLPKAYTPYVSSGASNSSRMVITPQPTSGKSSWGVYGALVPSNVAYENGYYYAFADYRELKGVDGMLVRAGVIMYRTTRIEESDGWEIYTASGWRSADPYVGVGGVAPKIFFEDELWNPYTEISASSLNGQSIHFHSSSGYWLLFGYDGRAVPSGVGITISPTLADPKFDDPAFNAERRILPNSSGYYPYLSVVDHESKDLNFLIIDDKFYLYFVQHFTDRAGNAQCYVDGGGNTVCDPNYYGRYLRRVPVEIAFTGPKGSEVPALPAAESLPITNVPVGLFIYGTRVFYSNGGQYCVFATWDDYVRILGRYEVEGIQAYPALPSGQSYAGICTGY